MRTCCSAVCTSSIWRRRSPQSCRAASGSASPSPVRSPATRACSCWTSRWERSTRPRAARLRVLWGRDPMAALDPLTRGGVRAELHDLLRERGLPALLVTHDFEDAAALADRIGVVADGRLRQVGNPPALLGSPADPFVARLAGANVLPGVAAR